MSHNSCYIKQLLLIVILAWSIANDIVSSKIYNQRNDFNLELVNILFLDGYTYSSLPYLWCTYFAANSFCKSMF